MIFTECFLILIDMGNRSILMAILALCFVIIVLINLPKEDIKNQNIIQKNQDSLSSHEQSKSNSNTASSQYSSHREIATEVESSPSLDNDNTDSDTSTLSYQKSALKAEPPIETQRLPQGEELKDFSLSLADRNWKIWNGITAVPQHQFVNHQQSIAGRINGYILINSPENLSIENFNSADPIVVYNERRQVPGVVTGTLSIKINKGVNIDDVLQEYQLKSLDSFPQIRLYYVTSIAQPFDLSQLFKSLQQDSRIDNIEVEILDRQYDQR